MLGDQTPEIWRLERERTVLLDEVKRLKGVIELWKGIAYRAQEGTLTKKLMKAVEDV